MKEKTLLLKMGAMALAVGVMLTSCSQSDPTPQTPSSEYRIRLGAGLLSMTKGVVDAQSTFTATVGGWENAAGADYTAAASWISTADVAASGTSALNLSPVRYYSQDGTTATYMKAWYPAGNAAAGKVDFAGADGYAGDGTDDVLFAGEVSGSALDADNKSLDFRHMTTQLKFSLTCDELFEGTATKILSIKLNNVAVPSGIDLQTDALVGTAVASLPVTGIAGDQTIAQAAALAGNPVMIVPFEGNKLSIDVETSDTTYHGVEVTLSDEAPVAGKAYTVALDFVSFELTARATVAEWDYSGTGSGTVEEEWGNM